MKAIPEEQWTPADAMVLEESAMDVVTAPIDNYLVVAGPGAGKTELLAQRACFLLQTNLCKYPHRIIAISFKRDAAYNLKQRVTLRAGKDLSYRFDSFTYDSFAKQLLDRFKTALPVEYLLPDQYEIANDDYLIDLYREKSETFVATNNRYSILNALTEKILPFPVTTNTDENHAYVWNKAVQQGKISFKMIMRLAELILNTNPEIKIFLQKTLDYVFLDEFQDTTSIQYDFLKTCFHGSNKVITAVGDDKQRIMVWAGARKTVFEDFLKDNEATRISLKMNFRSAPLLVNVQNSLVKSLLNKSDFATHSSAWKGTEGECMIWEFQDQKNEAKYLAEKISEWINTEKLPAREICILVKGSLAKYVNEIISALRDNKVNARDEGPYQEFLTDEVILYLVHSMYIVIDTPKKESRETVFSFLSRVNNELSDDQLLRLENKVYYFMKKLRNEFKGKFMVEKEIENLIHSLLNYAGRHRIRAIIPQYKQEGYLNKMISDFFKSLVEYLPASKDLSHVLDQFSGVDTIPVMTVHKSKGLEYDTVLFVGLEDGAFWSFNNQQEEDKSTFFVALSRAKMRVVFTFSKVRQGLKRTTQARDTIGVIFDELRKAGVKMHQF